MIVTTIPFAFAAEETTVITEIFVEYYEDAYPGGWSNDSEVNPHIGIQDEGKVALENGDELTVVCDTWDIDTWDIINTQTAILHYEDGQFNGNISFDYDENSYNDIYAYLGKGDGIDEYIIISGEVIGDVLYFDFSSAIIHYSRLRLAGEVNTSYEVTVDGFFTADNYDEPVAQDYTLTTDSNGNAYLYGTFIEGAILSVNGVACTLDYCNGTESEKSYAVCAVHNFSDGCCTECYVKCAHANCSNTVCNDCGYICIHSDTIVQVDAKAPTCTEIGWDAYEYCTACDYTTYVELPASGHTASPTYAPTADGSQHVATYSCCGYESNENHSFETGTCTGCGASWFAVSGNTVTIDGTLGGKTTATEDDIITLLDAIKGYVESGITTIIVTGSDPAIIHLDYGNWVFDMPAVSEALYRLTNEDSRSPYCGTIDLILPDVTEILDDEFNNSFAIKSLTIPKVTTVGDSAFYATVFLETITFGSVVTTIEQKSSVAFAGIGNEVGGCDLVLNCAQLQAEDTYKPELETNVWYKPSWGGGVTWKNIILTHNGGEATCIAKAVCETCGEEYGEFDANKHTLVQKDAKAPTCTEIGWEAYEYCTACDYTTYEEIPAIGHVFSTSGICDVCGEVCAHEWGEGVLTRPTRTEEGCYTYTCSICKDTKIELVERVSNYAEFKELLEKVKGYLDENLTDSMMQEVNNIINFFDLDENHRFIKGEENTVSQKIIQISEFVEVVEEGIADGTAVKVNGFEEIEIYAEPIEQELKEKYGEAKYQAVLKSMTDEAKDEIKKIKEEAEALEGSVKDNEEKLNELKVRVEAIYAKIENCLAGEHNGLDYEVTEEAKCGVNAIESATCTLCGDVLTREVENSALTHADEDGDYICDHGCGYEYEKPAPEDPTPDTPDEPNTPDEPDTPDEPANSTCDHLCHKSGFIGFIWKIVQLFSKLFKINPTCECGVAHY